MQNVLPPGREPNCYTQSNSKGRYFEDRDHPYPRFRFFILESGLSAQDYRQGKGSASYDSYENVPDLGDRAFYRHVKIQTTTGLYDLYVMKGSTALHLSFYSTPNGYNWKTRLLNLARLAVSRY